MSFKCQDGIVPGHTLTVVGDTQQASAPALEIDNNTTCACIDRVFNQLLGNRRRAFHDLARSDLVGKLIGKHPDFAHTKLLLAQTPESQAVRQNWRPLVALNYK